MRDERREKGRLQTHGEEHVLLVLVDCAGVRHGVSVLYD